MGRESRIIQHHQLILNLDSAIDSDTAAHKNTRNRDVDVIQVYVVKGKTEWETGFKAEDDKADDMEVE
jgi:hypothetical protein